MSSENINSQCLQEEHSLTEETRYISVNSDTVENIEVFEQWIHCLCVVTFDLEVGQAMEVIYPRTAKLSEIEKAQICYMAFPDSNSGLLGDTKYHFRVRVSNSKSQLDSSTGLNAEQIKFTRNCLDAHNPELEHLWGFVYFRQKKDKRVPRGYFQKSFIIMTRLPLFNLFYDIISKVAPIYFNSYSTISKSSKSNANIGISKDMNEDDRNFGQLENTSKAEQNEINSPNIDDPTEILVPGEKILSAIYQQINSEWPSLTVAAHSTTVTLRLFENLYKIETSSKSLKKNKANSTNLGESSNSGEISENLANDNIYTDFKLESNSSPIFCGELNIFKIFKYFVKNLVTLWELVVLGEPILVCANSPTECSFMVQSLVSIIQPLIYNAEYRPYFTIHDSEFREFTTNFNSPSIKKSTTNKIANSPGNFKHSIILGVTNPFFFKLLNNFPNIIKLPDMNNNSAENFPKEQQERFKFAGIEKMGSFMKSFETDTRSLGSNCSTTQKNSVHFENITSGLSNASLESSSDAALVSELGNDGNGYNKIKTSLSFNTLENTQNIDCQPIPRISTKISNSSAQPTLFTTNKPFLKPDKDLIEKIQCGIKTKRPEQIQSILIRRKFLELTQSFMIPLERYMASLMPLQKDIKPLNQIPQPQNFDYDEFLTALNQYGPQLTTKIKGDWKGLYKMFFQSPNFWGWYQKRYQELQKRLVVIQLQMLMEFDLLDWSKQKRECEIIDMILKIKEKLKLLFVGEMEINGYVKDSKSKDNKINNKLDISHKVHPTNEDYDEDFAYKLELRRKILEKLDLFIKTLPEDLQEILIGTKNAEELW